MEEKEYTCVFYYGDKEVFRYDALPQDFPHKNQKLIFHYHKGEIVEEQEFHWIVDELGILARGEGDLPEICFHIIPE